MALRMSEEEFAEWKRNRDARMRAEGKSAGLGKTMPGDIRAAMTDVNARKGRSAASPSCCQPARSSGVSLEEPEKDEPDARNGELPKKPSKYRNQRTEIDGKKFDSKHEATIYQELMLRVKAGELKSVLRQVKFDLPGGIQYVADFVTIAQDMRIEGVYDAKSPITKQNRVYINKKKQMLACYGIEIKEV